MKIKVTADSTCDLPQHIIDTCGIHLVPLHMVLGDQSYADRVEIDPARLFEYMQDPKGTCHTAGVNVAEYRQLFQQYQDYDAIIHISLSAALSSSYANAVQAATEFSNVYVVDSANVSAGSALLVERAVQLVSQGQHALDIVRHLRELAPKVASGILLSTLEYVRRGGRCSAIAELGAALLQIKVCLEIKNGCVQVSKKYRGTFTKCAKKYLDDCLRDVQGIKDDILYFATSSLEPELATAIRAMVEQWGHFKRIVDIEAGCVISCHSGPGAFALFYERV